MTDATIDWHDEFTYPVKSIKACETCGETIWNRYFWRDGEWHLSVLGTVMDQHRDCKDW